MSPLSPRVVSQAVSASAPDLATIRAAIGEAGRGYGHPLHQESAGHDRDGNPPRASVALVLAGDPTVPQLALIRRAEREGDPWSGQVALPGGRADPVDADAAAVAERETEEEVGLALRREHLIAPLDELPVFRGGEDTGMLLSPFVYEIGPRLPEFHPNHEVAAAFWVSLRDLLDPVNATRISFTRQGRRWFYPALQVEGHVLWGLTYRVLAIFFGRMALRLPAPP